MEYQGREGKESGGMSDESTAGGTNETRLFRLQFDMGTVPNPCHSVLSTVRYGIDAPHTQVSRYQVYFSCVYDLYDGTLFARL